VSTTLFLVVSLKNSDRAVRKFFWLTSSILEQKVTLAPMPLINLLPNTISSTVNTYPPTAVLSMPRHDSAQLTPPQKAPFSCSKVPIRRYDDASSINQPSTDSLVDSRSVLGARCHAFPPSFYTPEHYLPCRPLYRARVPEYLTR